MFIPMEIQPYYVSGAIHIVIMMKAIKLLHLYSSPFVITYGDTQMMTVYTFLIFHSFSPPLWLCCVP